MLSFENLLLPPRSWWLERGLTRAHHRIIGTMQAHLRSCIVPEKPFMALVDACRSRSAHTRSVLRVRLRQPLSETAQMLPSACPRALGILSIVIVVVVMEDEVRFLRWLLLFHLRLIEECDVEVLVAPSFRCDARAFPPLRRHAEPMRRFVVLRRRSSTTSSRHTDSAKNCMACFRGCWIEMCCGKSSRVLASPVPLVAWRPPAMVVPVVVTTVEIVPMKRTPSILLRRRIHRVPNLRVMPRCAASVEGGLHQHGRLAVRALPSCSPPAIVAVSASGVAARNRPPNSAVLVMAGGMCASVS